jgi:hypothetical protein
MQENTIPFRIFYSPAYYLGMATGVYTLFTVSKAVSNNDMYIKKSWGR